MDDDSPQPQPQSSGGDDASDGPGFNGAGSTGNGHDDWFEVEVGPESRPERHELLGVDPFYEEFHRTPFDPLYAAQVGGRLTGEVLRRPPGRGWMRAVAYLMAASLTVAGCCGLLAAGGFIAPYQPSPNWTLVKVLAFSVAFLIIAALLFWKLLHPSSLDDADALAPDDDDYDDFPDLP